MPRIAGRRCARGDAGRLVRVSTSSTVAATVVVGVVISMTSGVMVAVSGMLLLGTVLFLARSELIRRRDEHDLAEMLAATRALAREVRSGAVPSAAISATAAAHRGTSARVLGELAAAVAGDRCGRGSDHMTDPGSPDDVTASFGNRVTSRPAAEITFRLARAWSLSARYGVPLAALIDTVSTDLADRVRAGSQRRAQVAGPKVSGYVLAVMPGLGMLLGVGMGANPVHVLLGTGVGHLLLLTGSALTCAGLVWTSRIVRG